MSITQKVIATFILIVMFTSTIMPTVNAVVEDVLLNGTEEQILYQQDEQNVSRNKNQTTSKDFDVLLAGFFTKEDGVSENKLQLSDVPSIILQKPEQSGLYVEENSRFYFVNLVNSLTNKNYTIDKNGFLAEDQSNSQEKIFNSNYAFYTDKIDELINSKKTIFLTVDENYSQYNEPTNEILSIMIEKDEYALLFKNSKDNYNTSDIIILNQHKYNEKNTDNTNIYLMNKFLEIYYNEDDNFNNFVKDSTNLNIIENITENTNEITNEITENIIVDNSTELEGTTNILTDNSSLEMTPEQANEELEFDFDTILSGILYDINNVTLQDITTINDIKPLNYGIWVEENSREIFLHYLNTHSIYTYSIDLNGYLICDKIMKNNPNLDFTDKTILDIEIESLLNQDITFFVSVTSNYLTNENNQLTIKELENTEYLKTFDNNDYDNRIILLNSDFFNLDTKHDLVLLDRFVKNFLKYENSISLFSDTSKTGNMQSAQTVYAGPSASDYATVGSVDPNEQVYILGQSSGWYHIQYHVGSSGTQKSGFVPKSTVSNLNVADSDIHEEMMTGGQRYAKQNLSLQSCDDLSISTTVGTVYAGEGLTLLYDYGYVGDNGSYRIAYIEISTSTGTKRGYVYNDQLNAPNYNTSVARVTATNPAYSGPDSSYVKLGGAYYNEFVSVLAKEDDWVFVEYNTTSGRKRGFMSYTNLYNYNHPGAYNDLPNKQGLKQATQQLIVYGGPNSNNANIGSIFNQEVISLFGIENGYAYIEYSTANGAKRGYVLNSALIDANPPIIPNLTTYANFTSGIYGYSGLGQALKYYKIGTGENIAFVVFEQHGWEDAWAFDGIELINIADRVMNDLSTGINSNWSLYIIPYANPDGITNGYSNNGPGRCTVTTGIDMNRSWPANFSPYYTSRNYTGDTALGSPEGVALKNFINSNKGNGEKIIVDIHGWLNETYGDYSIAQYFDNQFSINHYNSFGSGYLVTWGKTIGATSCLVELPMPSSTSDIINRNFSGKLSYAIREMLNKNAGEGGTSVNELLRVVVDGVDLNLRSGPGTNYSIITTIPNGTIVTRIRKNVATANGYEWDKIRLLDGTEGYVVTNYLDYLMTDDLEYTSQTTGHYYSNLFENYYEQDLNSLANIIEGEQAHNSKTLTEELRESELTKKDIGIAAANTAYALGMRDAGNNLLYFLTSGQNKFENVTGDIHTYEVDPYKSGHTAKEIRFENAIDDSTAISTLVTALNEMMEAVENMDFAIGQTANIYCHNEINGDCNYLNPNWFLGVNNYRTRNYANVTKLDTGKYKMTFTHLMIDYYDWEKTTGWKNYIPLIGSQTEFAYLNEYGLSRNYTNYDKLTYSVQWNTGLRVGTGASISGPGMEK